MGKKTRNNKINQRAAFNGIEKFEYEKRKKLLNGTFNEIL